MSPELFSETHCALSFCYEISSCHPSVPLPFTLDFGFASVKMAVWSSLFMLRIHFLDRSGNSSLNLVPVCSPIPWIHMMYYTEVHSLNNTNSSIHLLSFKSLTDWCIQALHLIISFITMLRQTFYSFIFYISWSFNSGKCFFNRFQFSSLAFLELLHLILCYMSPQGYIVPFVWYPDLFLFQWNHPTLFHQQIW